MSPNEGLTSQLLDGAFVLGHVLAMLLPDGSVGKQKTTKEVQRRTEIFRKQQITI